ncbi:MAG: transposase [Anaerolineae bacterium]
MIADAKYGNHRFLAPLRDEPCGALVRLRRDRVLYGAPGAYSGRGRPRVHGERFAFKEPETWGEPKAMVELEHPRWGKVRLRRWDDKRACQDADTLFSVILVEAHLEQEKPSAPFCWVTSHLHTRRQKTSACGIGTNTAGQWSPAFVSVSSISTGHCPASRLQSAATG